MSPRLGRALRLLPSFPLASIQERRRRLEARGVDIIDVGAGDADLDPPPAAVARLQEAVGQRHYSRYAFQAGLPAFREAVSAWMRKRFGVSMDPFTELLPLQGSKDGLAHLPFAFLDAGDLAVLPDPGYAAYKGGVILAGGEPYEARLRREGDFLLPLRELRGDVAARARVVYLSYPNNPTTAEAPLEYLADAVEFCRERDALLVHDHAYSELAFEGYRPPSVFEVAGAKDVALELHTFSKTYNMTGWRLGWVAGNATLIGALAKIKAFVDVGVFLAVQAAGVAALESYDTWVPGNVARFQGRRDAALSGLRRSGFEVATPRATLYLWVPVPGDEPSEQFALRALEEEGVVVLPGRSLGAGGEGYFRVALTAPEERLAEAAARLGRVARG